MGLNIKAKIKNFLCDESGMGVVEIVLIIIAIFTHHYSMEKTCIR